LKDELIYWIKEREKIRLRKEAGAPKPWSNDPVFQSVYFCNVHREHDKTTKWIREKYSPYVDHPMFDSNIMLARLVNRIESLDMMGFMEEWNDDLFRNAEQTASPFWGGAYVVTTHGRPMSKIDYACEVLRDVFWRPPSYPYPSAGGTLKTAHTAIQASEGYASFMAAQVVADLKNTPGHPLQEAPDWMTFSAPGPGSLRGLSWYFDTKITAPRYHSAIEQAAEEIEWEGCMQDLQNVFCEFDKYNRVKTGKGRSKRKYDGS
jgi:hypothetical protein